MKQRGQAVMKLRLGKNVSLEQGGSDLRSNAEHAAASRGDDSIGARGIFRSPFPRDSEQIPPAVNCGEELAPLSCPAI